MINLETADAGDLLIELVRVRRSVARLRAQLDAELDRMDAVYAAVETKGDKLATIVHSCESQPEQAVVGARRRAAK